jgi:hypothetical protein
VTLAHSRAVDTKKDAAVNPQLPASPDCYRTRTSAALAGGTYTETVLPDVV